MSRLAFVESNTTGTGRLAIERLLAAGDRVFFLTRSRARYPFLAQPSAGLEVIDTETNDVDEVISAVADLHRPSPLDAVLTFSDFYVPIVAAAAARLGFRQLSPRAARICHDKYLTRQALASAGLATPLCRRVRSVEEALALLPAIRLPCVVKPPADSSSHGVRLVANREELCRQVELLAAERENIRGQRLDGTVLVESLIAGPEFSVETVTLAGGSTRVVGVTDKHLSAPPCFVETGHDFPSAAEPQVHDAIAAAAVAALAAVGFDFGPAHTEIRWTAEGAVVIEINPRLAGGMIPELVCKATGIDLLAVQLDLLLGREPELAPSRDDVAGIRFLTTDLTGRLAGLQGLDATLALPTVCQAQLDKPLGTWLQPAEDAYHRAGFVIASGPDRDLVRRDLDTALRLLRLEVTADGGT
jgi:biotin carboxylase